MVMVEPDRRRVGPWVVLLLLAVAVLGLFAYGTAENWFSFITGDLYRVPNTGLAALAPDEPDGTGAVDPSATPSPLVGDEAARQAGYDAGYALGATAGRTRGYDKGYRDGFRHGFQVGKRKGFNETEAAGYEKGYNATYRDGRRDGAQQLAAEFEAWRTQRPLPPPEDEQTGTRPGGGQGGGNGG